MTLFFYYLNEKSTLMFNRDNFEVVDEINIYYIKIL